MLCSPMFALLIHTTGTPRMPKTPTIDTLACVLPMLYARAREASTSVSHK